MALEIWLVIAVPISDMSVPNYFTKKYANTSIKSNEKKCAPNIFFGLDVWKTYTTRCTNKEHFWQNTKCTEWHYTLRSTIESDTNQSAGAIKWRNCKALKSMFDIFYPSLIPVNTD